MSTARTNTLYIFVIDTEQYSGNFERELCAYCTGCIGDCEVGDDFAERFKEEHPADTFDEYITQIGNEGCYRPCEIWPTPGWSNNGNGKAKKLEPGEEMESPSYQSVAIFFSKPIPEELVELIKERAQQFKPNYGDEGFTVTGFRKLAKVTTINEVESWD